MSEDLLHRYLDELPLGGWQFYDSLGSSNDVAMEWAKNGAGDMALVIADYQTSGRGRFKRHWVTAPGAALAFSLVLHPTGQELRSLYQFAGLGAVAIVETFDGLGLNAQIKWPNDVLLNRQKVAGILIENTWVGEALQALVIGIGINVSPPAVPPPDQVMFPATCLESVLGGPIDRWAVLKAVLENMIAWRKRFGTQEFFSRWDDRLAFKGEWVRISSTSGADLVGRLIGLSPQGSLRLSLDDGREVNIDAGDVHLRSVDNQ